MTYFGFLVRFLLVPIAVLGFLLLRDRRAGRRFPVALTMRPAWLAILIHVFLAVAWTTPWDNYLVATGVWWYDPARVTGLTLGWVPIEEYSFFVLQTVMTGLWLLWLARRLPLAPQPAPSRPAVTRAALFGLITIWLIALAVLLAGWQPGTYLALELIWLVPPMWPQAVAGAHVLWQQRRFVGLGILVPALYLSAADALAIGDAIWTIDPAQTTGLLIAGVLPVEELLFFFLTNTLIVFGTVLFLALDKEALRNLARRAAGWRLFNGTKEQA